VVTILGLDWDNVIVRGWSWLTLGDISFRSDHMRFFFWSLPLVLFSLLLRCPGLVVLLPFERRGRADVVESVARAFFNYVSHLFSSFKDVIVLRFGQIQSRLTKLDYTGNGLDHTHRHSHSSQNGRRTLKNVISCFYLLVFLAFIF